MNSMRQFKRRAETPPSDIISLTVRVPGSSANLGPGFDTLGLAFQLYCSLNLRLLEYNDKSVPLITLNGKLVDALPRDQNNLIYNVLKNLWQDDPDLLQRVRISIESEIPLGKGLGSSAAAIVGAVWAAYTLTQDSLDNRRILLKATELEGHPDNAAASLYGGLVVSARSSSSRAVVTQKVSWPADWATIVCVPPYALRTKQARAVLPKQLSYPDAVHNVQKVALLMAAVQNKDEEAMQEALHDKIHEQYRQSLVPELPEIRKAVSDLPVIGCVLSGAGSSVLTIVHQRHRRQVYDCLRDWSAAKNKNGEVLDLSVDHEGLKVSYE